MEELTKIKKVKTGVICDACTKCGSEIELICDGEQENEALAEGAKMIEDGFGE